MIDVIWAYLSGLLPHILPWVGWVLGSVLVLLWAYVKATINKEDDAKFEALLQKPIIGPVLSWLFHHAPIQNK